MIAKLAADNDYFLATCNRLLSRMIDTVPQGVVLSDVITPIDVKPKTWTFSVSSNGTITVRGRVRVSTELVLPTTLRGFLFAYPESSQIARPILSKSGATVRVYLSPRLINGNIPDTPSVNVTATTNPDLSSDCLYPNCGSPGFQYYEFEAFVPVSQGVSAFKVEILDNNSNSNMYDNGGDGFPLPDLLIPLRGPSCVTVDPITHANGLNITVGVSDINILDRESRRCLL
jgi:hypothetical protein